MEKYNPVYVTTVLVCIFLFSLISSLGIFSKDKKENKKPSIEKEEVEKNTEENKD